MSSDTQWFYGRGSERRGPYSRDQLMPLIEAGAIDGQTLVWSEGMGDWQPLASTPLAFGLSAQQLAPKQSSMGSMAYAGDGAAGLGAAPPMGFGAAIASCFSKYVTFSGRASRSEFWYFFLFVIVGSFITGICDGLLILATGMGDSGIGPFGGIFTLAVFLPQVSAAVRRLHDTDRSGWWWWLQLVPLAGIVVLVFLCQRGTPGRNRFG